MIWYSTVGFELFDSEHVENFCAFVCACIWTFQYFACVFNQRETYKKCKLQSDAKIIISRVGICLSSFQT